MQIVQSAKKVVSPHNSIIYSHANSAVNIHHEFNPISGLADAVDGTVWRRRVVDSSHFNSGVDVLNPTVAPSGGQVSLVSLDRPVGCTGEVPLAPSIVNSSVDITGFTVAPSGVSRSFECRNGVPLAPSIVNGVSSDIVRTLNVPYWEQKLPLVVSPGEVVELLEGLASGVRIGRSPAVGSIVSSNWPSANELAAQVSEVIDLDLAQGRLFGPFRDSPYTEYIISPLGAFLKRNSKKARVIHDLSFPAVGSVNAQIDPDEYSCQYSSIDDAVDLCCRVGPDSVVLAKVDLKDAFKHIPIHPGDWHMMGFIWPDASGVPAHYFSKVLSFGLRSAPSLFDRYARCLPGFCRLEGFVNGLVRYVDDFLIVADSVNNCQADLDVLVDTCVKAGFTIQPAKVTSPCKVIEFLGIEVDTVNSILRISDERMLEVRSILAEWTGRKSCSKRQLLRLIGKLAFAARVVRKGRAFLGRLIGLAKNLKYLHYRTKLNMEARRDIKWWSQSLASHNGTGIFPRDWSGAEVQHVYTDASNYGYGASWCNEWFAISYVAGSSDLASQSINWRELHVAVKALATWGHHWSGGLVIFHIDNQAACGVLSKLYTPTPELMELVRSWALLLEQFNIEVKIEYIRTDDNICADALSRGMMEQFKINCPQAAIATWPHPVSYFDRYV